MSKTTGNIGVVTSKGQTTIPKSVRESLGIHTGSQLQWVVEDGKATVTPRNLRMVDLAGLLGNPLGRAVTVEEMNEAIGAAIAERYERAIDRS